MNNPQKSIYLDWNIFQDIKHKRSSENLFEKLCDAKKNGYIIPYSSAHLRDLSRCNNDKYIEEDLEFISKISNNWCIGVNKTDESIFIHQQHDPKKIFQQFSSVKKTNIKDLNLLHFFKPYKVECSNISKENIIIPYLKKNNYIISPEVIHDLIHDLYKDIFDNHKLQKKFRTSVQEVIKLNNPAFTHLLEMPFYKHLMSDHLTINNEFKKIVSSFLKITGKDLKTIKYGEKITTSYNILDFFPTFSEKLHKRNNIKNISTDSEHAFLGSSATYFIGNDTNMIKKTKIIYQNFNIKTKIFDKITFSNNINFF